MKKIVSGLLLVILTVLLLVFSWLGLTQSGMLWLYQFSSDVIPGKFQVNQLSGNLIGPIELSDVHYLDADGSDYSAHKIIFDWNPVALLSGSLDIQSLSIQSLHAVIAQKAKQSDNTKKAGIADIKHGADVMASARSSESNSARCVL